MTRDELMAEAGRLLGIKNPNKRGLPALYLKLKELRVGLHPDNFQNAEISADAERQFKEITPLLEAFERELESDEKSNLPALIAKDKLASPANLHLEMKLRRTEDELRELSNELELTKSETKRLAAELDSTKGQLSRQSAALAKEKTVPKNLPQKLSVGVTGALALLTSLNKDLFGLLDQFKSNNFIPADILPYAFWLLFGVVAVLTLRQEFKKSRLSGFLDGLYNATIRKEFFYSVEHHKSVDENEIAEFIRSRVDPSYGLSPFRRSLRRIWGRTFITDAEIEYLTRAFIARLEEDDLISYLGSSKFQRRYKITDSVNPYWLSE